MIIWSKDDSKNPWKDISLLNGRYLFTFKVPLGKSVPNWVNQSLTVGGKTFIVHKAYMQNQNFVVDLEVKDNPLPVVLILATLLAAFTYLSLQKIEKITDGYFPVMILAGCAVVYFVFAKGRGKWNFT